MGGSQWTVVLVKPGMLKDCYGLGHKSEYILDRDSDLSTVPSSQSSHSNQCRQGSSMSKQGVDGAKHIVSLVNSLAATE